MKKLILTILTSLFLNVTNAAPVNKLIINNGPWNSNSSWSLGRQPNNGDTVVIPQNMTVLVTSDILMAPGSIFLKIYGVFKMIDKEAFFGVNTKIYIYSTGSITNFDNGRIEIDGNRVYDRNGTLTGPRYADSTTNGFVAFTPLPVKFVSFTATKINVDVLVQWSTAEEIEASHFVIERSLDGQNWLNVSTINAKGNSIVLTRYAYTDKNVSAIIVYYRIKQVDTDGRFTYTSIKKVQSETNNTSVQITSVQQHILLQFAEEVKGNVTVQVVSLSGQVVDHQTIRNPVGQVVLNTRCKGNYIVSISNAQSLHVAKQIIL